MITRADWDNWKADPVTRAFFAACAERASGFKEVLAVTAGENPSQDSKISGYIGAYTEITEFKVEDVNEDD